MSLAHCDLTEPELGMEINVFKSPLKETIRDLNKVDHFLKKIIVIQNMRLRSWMPRILKNGDIPRTMQRDTTWILSDCIDASNVIACDVRDQVIQMYHNIFPPEVDHTNFICQKANHIAVNNGNKMKAALSYFVHATNVA